MKGRIAFLHRREIHKMENNTPRTAVGLLCCLDKRLQFAKRFGQLASKLRVLRREPARRGMALRVIAGQCVAVQTQSQPLLTRTKRNDGVRIEVLHKGNVGVPVSTPHKRSA